MPKRTNLDFVRFIHRMWARSPVRYVVVGGFAFGFDGFLLFLLHDGFRLPLAPSTAVAFLTSFVVTYVLQRILTFRSRSGITASTVKYTLLVIANTFAVTGIVAAASALGLPWLVGKLVAVVGMTVWNYFAYRHWVFAAGPSGPPDGPLTSS